MNKRERLIFINVLTSVAYGLALLLFNFHMENLIMGLGICVLLTALTIYNIRLAKQFYKLPKAEKDKEYVFADWHPYYTAFWYSLITIFIWVVFVVKTVLDK